MGREVKRFKLDLRRRGDELVRFKQCTGREYDGDKAGPNAFAFLNFARCYSGDGGNEFEIGEGADGGGFTGGYERVGRLVKRVGA